MAKRSILNIFRKNKTTAEPVTDNPQELRKKSGLFGALAYSSGSTYRESEAMALSAVYRCVTLLSDSIAQLPVEIYNVDSKGFKSIQYKHPYAKILNETPNRRMTRFIFIQSLIRSMLLRGDAFAYIERDAKGNINALHYIPSEYVTIITPKYLNEAPTYSITGMSEEIPDSDMIHLFLHTDDGINGVSILTNAKKVLSLSWAAEENASTIYENGGSLFGILKSDAPLRDEQKQEFYQSWDRAKNGSGKNNGVILLPEGFSYQSVSISPADQQLLESRKWNVLEICRIFGIPASRLMIETSTSYGGIEAENLIFLSALQPYIERLEEELNRKIFPDKNTIVKFNVTELMRSDSTTLINYISKSVSWGIMSINEGRNMLGLPALENGDKAFVPVNIMPLDAAVTNKPADNKISTEDINVIENPAKEE